MDGRGDALLEKMRAERGYLLSYHEVYGRLDPTLLERYADLYRAFTLDRRFLEPRRRELVWIGLLAAIDEHVGSIHLERAVQAGVTPRDMAAALSLAAVAGAWPTIAFGAGHWERFVEARAEDLYAALVDAGRGPIEPHLADLILIVVHGARRTETPFVYHLGRALTAGIPEPEVAEAVSYLLLPTGANTLLWATDAWVQALRDGRLRESPTMGRAAFETRVD